MLNQTPDIQILVSQQSGLYKPLDGGACLGSPVALFYADGTVQGYGFYQVQPDGSVLGGEAYGFPASICA